MRIGLVVLLVPSLFACSSSGGPSADPLAATPDAAARELDDASTNTEGPPSDGASTDGASTDGAIVRAEDVPAVRLAGDPARDCPVAYRTKAPVEGDNDSFVVGGEARKFTLLLPKRGEGPRPLFVAFNGTGENGRSFARRAQLDELAAAGFVVVAPWSAGHGKIWPVWDGMRNVGAPEEPAPDLAFFDALLACVAGHVEVDRNRIYVGGHSAGGIMTNYVVQRRSAQVAAAIVGSGVFSLTSPREKAPLSPLAVVVTWGGDNDKYRGGANGVTVPEFDFVEQAALATAFYADQPGVETVWCKGKEIGHAWLPTNAWFVKWLLAHPKGATATAELPSLGDAPVTCARGKAPLPPKEDVVCPPAAKAGCQDACQFFADCAVENKSVASPLKPQLATLGFGDGRCEGCVARCLDKSTAAEDDAVLECIGNARATATCGSGIEGVLPLVDAVNGCCAGKKNSGWCKDVCTILDGNTSARSFFTTCAEFR
jgi:poly(3-hydroxybutyrate) depolymerase